jgi:hypothetical protein
MELFSEIYGCYYNAIRKVLETIEDKGALTYDEIIEIINETAFIDSAFFIMPYLQSGEWGFLLSEEESSMEREKHLSKNSGHFLSRTTTANYKLPITTIGKAWIKSLLEDKRIKLFLDDNEINSLLKLFNDVPKLFDNEMFYIFDIAKDGDEYTDSNYIKNFRTILNAIK